MKGFYMKSTKFWIILTSVVLLISCISAAAVLYYNGTGNTVCIYQNGDLIEKIHLDTVTMPYTIHLGSKNGGYNEITVEEGRICVSDASCPDHICINTGWISDGAIPIVCLPNQLVIQIEGERSEIDIAAQ